MEQMTLWRYPSLVERAAAVLAAARAERRDLGKRGPRRTNAGAPRTVNRIARIRAMDDALVSDAGDGYLGTAEIRLPRAVMYELHHDLSLADCDRDYGWPTGTAAALKHRYPERWRKERNRCIDWGVSQFQSARLSVMEQLTAGCENALTILKAAMSGDQLEVVRADGTTELRLVTKDMQIAAREWIKAARDLGRDLGEFTPADTGGGVIDDESEQMEAHAERLGVNLDVEAN